MSKARKPRALLEFKYNAEWSDMYDRPTVCGSSLYARDCRRLAAWLLKAAAYLDGRKDG